MLYAKPMPNRYRIELDRPTISALEAAAKNLAEAERRMAEAQSLLFENKRLLERALDALNRNLGSDRGRLQVV